MGRASRDLLPLVIQNTTLYLGHFLLLAYLSTHDRTYRTYKSSVATYTAQVLLTPSAGALLVMKQFIL